MHHAEALPTDWLELAEEERAQGPVPRRLSESPDVSDQRREQYLRAAMHYEVEALCAQLRDPVPMHTEDRP